mgnify:CR=1 FL=1
MAKLYLTCSCLPLVARRGHLCDLDVDSLGPLKLWRYGTQAERDPVPPLRHEVALDVGDVDEVLLAPLALEEAVTPRPAEVSHSPCLDVPLQIDWELFYGSLKSRAAKVCQSCFYNRLPITEFLAFHSEKVQSNFPLKMSRDKAHWQLRDTVANIPGYLDPL